MRDLVHVLFYISINYLSSMLCPDVYTTLLYALLSFSLVFDSLSLFYPIVNHKEYINEPSSKLMQMYGNYG